MLLLTTLSVYQVGESSPSVPDDLSESFVKVDVRGVPPVCFDDACDTEMITISNASGGIVGNHTVLTAGHVCNNFVSTAMIFDDVKMILVDRDGGEHVVTSMRVSDEADICLLKTDELGHRRLRLAWWRPSDGSVVFSPEAPLGIYTPGHVLIFSGIYSGASSLPGDNSVSMTVPSRPGSSGSPVVNANGRLVSVIFATAKDMESISLGVSLDSIRRMVSDDCDVVTSAKCLKEGTLSVIDDVR
jgi:S1-C subfamily serine protease